MKIAVIQVFENLRSRSLPRSVLRLDLNFRRDDKRGGDDKNGVGMKKRRGADDRKEADNYKIGVWDDRKETGPGAPSLAVGHGESVGNHAPIRKNINVKTTGVLTYITNLLFLIFPITLLVSCSDNNNIPGGSGLIEATEVTISSETAGQIIRLDLEEGDKIATGDTIAMIDTVTASLRLRQAEAACTAAETRLRNAEIAVEQVDLNLTLAEKEYDRAKALIKSGSMNQQQYDQFENAHSLAVLARKQARTSREAAAADLKRIEADIELLHKQWQDCFPAAPISGMVTEKYIEAGELAILGKALIKIARLDTVWVKIYLNSSDLTKIRLGSSAEIDPEDGREAPLSGVVTWISAAAEFTPKNVQTKEARANMVYAVKIIIPNPDQTLKIGMPVAVRIP